MASIQTIKSPLTGEISYRAQVRVKGRPAESKTFTSKKNAETWAKSLEAAIDEGRDFPHAKARRTSFDALAQDYIETALAEFDAKEKATRVRQLAWWSKQFAGKSLAELKADVISKARDACAAETFTRGKARTNKKTGVVTPAKEYKRTGATVNRFLATLSHAFSFAVKERRLLDRNPVSDLARKKESRGRIRFLSDAERDALLAACAKSQWPALYTLVLLAISTGARKGELIQLKWKDVTFEAKGGRAVVHETKNGDPRVLPLVGKSLEAMRELKLQNSARSEYVFPQPSGIPGPYEHFDGYWYDALTASGISDFHFHDLRHTCASYLASQGASLLEIADVLGHRTMQMVKRYSHLAQGHKTSVVEKMAKERGL